MNIFIRIKRALRELDVKPRTLPVHFIRDITGLSDAEMKETWSVSS